MSVPKEKCFYKEKMKYFTGIIVPILVYDIAATPGISATGKSVPGDLNKVQLDLQTAEKCSSCHDAKGHVDPGNCLNCHEALSQRIKSSTGFHRDKKEDCSDCHQEHQGKNSRLIDFDINDFDHSETGYILTGAHKKKDLCSGCHSGSNSITKKFRNSFFLRSSECRACHADVHNGMYPACEECHSTENWSVDTWN